MEKVVLRALKPRFTSPLFIKRTFFEPDRYGFPTIRDEKHENLSLLQRIKKARKEFKGEFKLFIEEIQSNIYPPNIEKGRIDIIWKFNETQKSLDQWIVNCDQDYHRGYSIANLELSANGTGIFHGVLDTRVPQDGITSDSGYCNITTVPKLKSFKRSDVYDWSFYNELVLRVRGDGRCYMLNMLHEIIFETTQTRASHYFMYTRGGPLWQIVRIPFAKFLIGFKGSVNENQYPVPTDGIMNFGITIADKKPGPFRLEIDYIGLCCNANLFENFAYETYTVPRKN